ncbi:MAG: hypothetical protein GF313_02895 [Caldithrix sp.]|nr:hypothetical protein [Caldithrix sp.]
MEYIKENKVLGIALLLSLLLHVLFFMFSDFQNWLQWDWQETTRPQEVTITFAENQEEKQQKQWEIVQNENFNEQIPEESDLLSDRNSEARNTRQTERTSDQPYSVGNQQYENLSAPNNQPNFFEQQTQKFSREALIGESEQEPRETQKNEPKSAQRKTSAQSGSGSPQRFDQREFSTDELGGLTLSTYQWNWAPYVNALKNKLFQVWYFPTAYPLGLISGATVIIFTISREGKLTDLQVVDHRGHESLRESSVNAIRALFPFKPLPQDFPEKALSIRALLEYQDLKQRR